MNLPRTKDYELQIALLSAISRVKDGVAIADEIRNEVIKKLLMNPVPIEQEVALKTIVSWSLIHMRDTEKWLTSPFYESCVNGQTSAGRQWIRTNKPGFNPNQRIWKITEAGLKQLEAIPNLTNPMPPIYIS